MSVKSNVRAGGGLWSPNHNQTVKAMRGRRARTLSCGLLLAASLLFLTAQAGVTRTGGLSTAAAAPAPQSGPVSWTFTTVDFPGFATVTSPLDMNTLGDMVGYYDPSGAWRGYLKLKDGPFMPVDFPGATLTVTLGINDRRDIVGVCIDRAGFQHGFRLSDGVFTSIDMPGAAQTRGVQFEFGPGLGTAAFGINRDGDIVGSVNVAAWRASRGFL
ncbi:MAG TPA: hypothetical protein VN282_23525 [Pyrinomonadaceae bacterium]|nr:hypothetical protein [Pyrinomonadaceae bacterium]